VLKSSRIAGGTCASCADDPRLPASSTSNDGVPTSRPSKRVAPAVAADVVEGVNGAVVGDHDEGLASDRHGHHVRRLDRPPSSRPTRAPSRAPRARGRGRWGSVVALSKGNQARLHERVGSASHILINLAPTFNKSSSRLLCSNTVVVFEYAFSYRAELLSPQQKRCGQK